MSDVKRYVTTCDCMSPAAWGDYVRYDDYAALEAELAKLRAGQEPVAYITGQFAGRCVIEAINRAAVLPTGMALYSAPQPSAVPVVHGLDADDVRAACQNAVEVFAEEQHAQLCREVAEYMRVVLLVDLELAAPAPVQAEPASPRTAELLEALTDAADALERAEFFEQAEKAKAVITPGETQ